MDFKNLDWTDCFNMVFKSYNLNLDLTDCVNMDFINYNMNLDLTDSFKIWLDKSHVIVDWLI